MVHLPDLFIGMAFEIGFRHLYRRMPHRIADQLLLIIPIVGDGSPTVAGTIATERNPYPGPGAQALQAGIETSQRILILPIGEYTARNMRM